MPPPILISSNMFIVNDNGFGHAGDGLKRFAFPSLRETDGGLGDALYELGFDSSTL
ncbi:hypothetical protein [Paraburkholderia franconis]|uniref:hypothetical protein n=1 Tax=Paraburkholderia franconis TaxID=2654983 RepID=UPI00187B958C|nr:hypothetical protein [Paraburkholderia franconis]